MAGAISITADQTWHTIWTGDVQVRCLCVEYASITCHPVCGVHIRYGVTDLDGSDFRYELGADIGYDIYSHYSVAGGGSSTGFSGGGRIVSVEVGVEFTDRIPASGEVQIKACVWVALGPSAVSCAAGGIGNGICWDGTQDRVHIVTT